MGAQMNTGEQLMAAFLDPPMHYYFAHKFSSLTNDELRVRIEETLKFLFISHECTGPIPVSKEIDEICHAWILQTREYAALCERLPAQSFIHHSSNDYLGYFDSAVGEVSKLTEEVKMLALYAANFGGFDSGRTKYWLLANHLVHRRGWSVAQLNDWLLSPIAKPEHDSGITAAFSFAQDSGYGRIDFPVFEMGDRK
jgi:hypothetical protein